MTRRISRVTTRRSRALALAIGNLIAGLLALLASPAVAADLITSLSNSLVAITTGFTGSNVLVFGATDGGGDVIVVVRGPESREVVRRKARTFGIWINEAEVVFDNVPGFFAVASSRPPLSNVPPGVARLYQIGTDQLRLLPQRPEAPAVAQEFRSALIRAKQRDAVYSQETSEIQFLGNRLFRTDMWIPANAPVGTYSVSVYLLRDNEIVSAEITPLLVSRVGFEARVFEFAHDYAVAYGILAIGIAAIAGWIANLVFRKG